MRTVLAPVFGLILSSTVLFSTSALADKKSLKVEGMHCKGCVEMITGEVCGVQKFKTCKVKLAKGKKNTGVIELETEGKTPIEVAKVKSAVQAAGEYTVTE